MADIFISYAREDREAVALLAEKLGGEGLSVWWDRNIAGGAEFSQTIEAELEAAAHVIVAWSSNSVASHWVRDEAEHARERGKLIPITIDGTIPPLGFRQLHALNFDTWKGETDGDQFVELMTAIGPITKTTNTESTTKKRSVKPRVAVLPFNNMSTDDEIEHVADGIAEDLISTLSGIQHLSVPARNSTFVYKGQSVDVKQAAQALGARYIVEGSVRKLGPRIRVTAQFIKADDGAHIWAKKFDQPLEDYYENPDHLVQILSSSIFAQSTWAEAERTENVPEEDLTAWEHCQRTSTVIGKGAASPANLHKCITGLRGALEMEPDYGLGHALLSWACIAAYINGVWEDGKGEDLVSAWGKHLGLARQFAKGDLLTLAYVGASENYAGQQDRSLETLEYVLERDPAMATAWYVICMTYSALGRFDEARRAIARADELAPEGGYAANHPWYMGLVDFQAGEYVAARPAIERSVILTPDYGYLTIVAAVCAHHAGDHKAARRHIAQTKRSNPQLTPEKLGLMLNGQAIEGKGEKDLALIKELWGED